MPYVSLARQEISDSDQLEYATTNGYVFVSSDNDLLNPRMVPQLTTGAHAGVLRLREGPTISVGDQGRFLRYVAETETMDTMAGLIRYFERIPRGLFPDD